MRSSRNNFTDRQRAEIYVRDRALCSISGKSLWLLDYGAAPSHIDWVDHIIPAAKGGTNDLENGACTSWYYNWKNRHHKTATYLFSKGRPTDDYFFIYERITPDLATHLERFGSLHWSDWHFNRAVFCTLVPAYQYKRRRADGRMFTRGRDYWASLALKHLDKWRVAMLEAPSMRKRGLIPDRLSIDQRLILSIKLASLVTDIKSVVCDLTPYVRESEKATSRLSDLVDKNDAKRFLKEIVKNPYVVPRTKGIIRHNISLMF